MVGSGNGTYHQQNRALISAYRSTPRSSCSIWEISRVHVGVSAAIIAQSGAFRSRSSSSSDILTRSRRPIVRASSSAPRSTATLKLWNAEPTTERSRRETVTSGAQGAGRRQRRPAARQSCFRAYGRVRATGEVKVQYTFPSATAT